MSPGGLTPLADVLRATGFLAADGEPYPGLSILKAGTEEVPGDGPDAVWRDRGGVEVHFKLSRAAPSPAEASRARLRAWNTGSAALLWLVSPDRVDVLNAYGRPRGTDDDGAYLLETFRAVERGLARLDAYAGRLALESGRFWAVEDRVRSGDRVDAQLLGDLRRLEHRLVRANLPRPHAQALIGRTMFLCYLRDRGIAGPSEHEAFAPGCLTAWLRDGKHAYDLFAWLRETFNGDLFPVTQDELQAVTEHHTGLVADAFDGMDLDSGQLPFWPYRFDVVPIELISSIYEQFVHASDGAEARDTGVHYTPVSLVNLVLDEALAGVRPDARVLDLTCGSGVFLVEALRRLVDLQGGEAPRTRELVRRVLHAQLFGVDRSEGAIRVAAFSLYLAALELDPEPEPLAALRFEPLVGRSLFVADALGRLSPEVEPGTFDVIVGNPPWTYAGPRTSPGRLPTRPLPPRSADFRFVWRALDFGHGGARVGMVMRATPFFSRALASRRACAALLEAVAPATIVDVSALRDSLFPTADYPAVVLLGRLPQQPDASSVAVVKVPWTAAFARSGTFEVAPDDIRSLPLAAFGADFPWLKVTAFGTGRDRMLLRRLAAECRTLGQVVGEIGGRIATGAQMLLGDANDAAGLIGLPLLRSSSLTPLVDAATLPRFAAERVHRPRSRDIYRAPLVLVGEGPSGGRLAVGFSEVDLVYTESFYGISLAGMPREQADVVAGVLASTLPAWHLLLTASEFAVHKRKLLRQDLLDLPMPSVGRLGSSEAARVAQAVRDLRERDGPAAYEALDDAVSGLFGLSDQERMVVRDGARRAAEEYADGRVAAEAAPSTADLRAYAQAFLGVVNPWQRLDGRTELGAQVLRVSADAPLRVVRFAPDAAGRVRDVRVERPLNEVLSDLGRRLRLPVGRRLRVSRQLRVYAGEEVFVVKPSARRHWTPGVGLDDADRCLGDALGASDAAADADGTAGREPTR